ncbi:MAG: biotin--[acetyl-CoA-carboxylase] ligase, partial [Desulfobacterales bacterium]|nr:biotin--[acetyl-CoA-carboxylase] ligase [Desulfobacterales bacterium]
MDKRTEILKHIYDAGENTISGVRLSERTGISRVAVWKHINALKGKGFDIKSGPKGYRLAHARDLLHPFCFSPELRDRILYYPELTSTMDRARELAREGAAHLTCVVAEHQSKGRGRLNRKWDSDMGGLWFTLILTPDTPPPLAYLYNFAAGLVLSRTLSSQFDLDVRVKWPNDLLLEGKKLVGLLSEMETRADMLRFLLIGIGINVNNTVQGDQYQHNAIALEQALGEPVSRRE